MKCRKCRFENPASMKFCRKCGTELELACPNCSASYSLHLEFCGACWHNLGSPTETTSPKDLSSDEKPAKIRKFLPGCLTEKILSQRLRIEGERRHITIMFANMKGFTPLTGRLGLEETFMPMDQIFEILIHEIHDYEVTLNEFRGDGGLGQNQRRTDQPVDGHAKAHY